MESFRHDGHLTEEALLALVRQDPLEELERLEMAEHLAFCDQCLQRYTELLSADVLLTPRQSCREPLLGRIRRRTVRFVTSRYATAAAAVVLALTLLWGELDVSGIGAFGPIRDPDRVPALSERFSSWSEHWSGAMDAVFDRLNGIWHGGQTP